MNFTTNLLLELARSIGQSTPEAGDNSIEIPSTFLPTITPESPLDVGSNPTVNVAQRQSWQNTGFNSVIGGAGAAAANIGQCGPGLWEIDVLMSICSNFFRSTAVLFPVNIRMEIPAATGVSHYLAGTYEMGTATDPKSQTIFVKKRILLSSNGQIVYNVSNNAAAEFTLFSFSVLARKLL